MVYSLAILTYVSKSKLSLFSHFHIGCVWEPTCLKEDQQIAKVRVLLHIVSSLSLYIWCLPWMYVCYLFIFIFISRTHFHINFYIVTFIAFYCSVSEVFIVYRRTEFLSIIFILLDLMMGSILMSPLAGPVDSLTSHHGIFALISAQTLE